MYQLTNVDLPTAIGEMFTFNTAVHTHFTRQHRNPHTQQRNSAKASKNICYIGPEIWNSLPLNLQNSGTPTSFIKKLKVHLIHDNITCH